MFFSTYEIQQTQSSQDRKAEGDTISSGVGLPQTKWTSGWWLFVGYLTSQQHVMMQSTSGTSGWWLFVGYLTSQQHVMMQSTSGTSGWWLFVGDLTSQQHVMMQSTSGTSVGDLTSQQHAVYLWDLCWRSDVPATCSLPLGPLLAI